MEENKKTRYELYGGLGSELLTWEEGDSISAFTVRQLMIWLEGSGALWQYALDVGKDKRILMMSRTKSKWQTESLRQLEAMREVCESCKNSKEETEEFQKRIQRVTIAMLNRMVFCRREAKEETAAIKALLCYEKGNLKMIECALQYSLCPRLRSFLQSMLAIQRQSVRDMQILLWWVRHREEMRYDRNL